MGSSLCKGKLPPSDDRIEMAATTAPQLLDSHSSDYWSEDYDAPLVTETFSDDWWKKLDPYIMENYKHSNQPGGLAWVNHGDEGEIGEFVVGHTSGLIDKDLVDKHRFRPTIMMYLKTEQYGLSEGKTVRIFKGIHLDEFCIAIHDGEIMPNPVSKQWIMENLRGVLSHAQIPNGETQYDKDIREQREHKETIFAVDRLVQMSKIGSVDLLEMCLKDCGQMGKKGAKIMIWVQDPRVTEPKFNANPLGCSGADQVFKNLSLKYIQKHLRLPRDKSIQSEEAQRRRTLATMERLLDLVDHA